MDDNNIEFPTDFESLIENDEKIPVEEQITTVSSRGVLVETMQVSGSHELLSRRASEDNADFCRICHDSASCEQLISPCRCKGTLSLVHRTCLERWLAASDTSFCELCGMPYTTIRTQKYPWKIVSVFRWLRNSENRPDARDLALDLLTFALFTPMAAVFTYLGIFATENYYLYDIEVWPGEMTSTRFMALLSISMIATLDMAYLSWLLLRAHYHIFQWRSWWRRQCVVKLIFPTQPPSHHRNSDQ